MRKNDSAAVFSIGARAMLEGGTCDACGKSEGVYEISAQNKVRPRLHRIAFLCLFCARQISLFINAQSRRAAP